MRLGLTGMGRVGSVERLGQTDPVAAGNRVEYHRQGVVEQWTNGPLGLEQTFVVGARPAGSGPLDLTVGYAGAGVGARLAAGQVLLRGAHGELRYGGLVVTDAHGRRLHAWLAVRAGRIVIGVDDAGAAYPLRVDPFVQQAELTASDGVGGELGGGGFAISGSTLVVGAPNQSTATGSLEGAAYVFTEPASGWANATQTAELTASDAGIEDEFGTSVAISGQTIAVGGGFRKSSGTGAVYVFNEPASGWTNATQSAKLTASDGVAGDALGASVVISGQTILAGASGRQVGTTPYAGAVYVFDEPASGWASETQTAELTVPSIDGALNAGLSLAVSGSTLAVGAPSGTEQVDVFTAPASGWANATFTAELTASDPTGADEFGRSVAISDDTIVAGANAHAMGNNPIAGAVYVYTKPASGWANATQTAELTASDGGGRLGESVGISGQTIIAGASFHTVGANGNEGALYEFDEPAGGWTNATESSQLTASDGSANDFLGTSVLFAGSTIFAGAPDRNEQQGAVYVFQTPAATSLTTSLTGGGSSGATVTVPPGTPVTDTATLSGIDAAQATGTVAYTVYSDSACTTAVTGGTPQAISTPGTIPASVSATLSTPGTYYWQARYEGDPGNQASESACGSEVETVQAPAPGADLAVSLQSPSATVAGTSFQATVTVTNSGPQTAKNVVIGLLLPRGITRSDPAGRGGLILAFDSALPAGQTFTDTVPLTSSATASGHTLLTAAALSLTTPDPHPANNVVFKALSITPASATAGTLTVHATRVSASALLARLGRVRLVGITTAG